MAEEREPHEPCERPDWHVALPIALVGVGVGAAIGAATGMWWMMGVLGGVFASFAPLVGRRTDRTPDR